MTSSLGHPDGHEFALDRDGTAFYFTGVVTTQPAWDAVPLASSVNAKGLNDWVAVGFVVGTASQRYMRAGLLFPEPRQITAHSLSYTNSLVMQYSTDCTSLGDGTWQNVAVTDFNNADLRKMRANPAPLALSGVKGVRYDVSLYGASSLYFGDIHLWGLYPKAGLELWHPTLDRALKGEELDFGDVVQGAIKEIPFRVKNNSAQTANNVLIGVDGSIAVGGIAAGMTFNHAGGAFATSVTIPSIAPGAISATIVARRTIAFASPLGIGVTRMDVSAGSWT
jgi:hypothetical protein